MRTTVALLLMLFALKGAAIDTLVRDPAIRPTTSNYTDNGTANYPWRKVYSAQGFYENGVKLTNSAAGTAVTTMGWQIVTNHQSTVIYPEFDGFDTNGTVLTYSVPADGMYRLEFADTFYNTDETATTFDGRYMLGLAWTHPGNATQGAQLFDMPTAVDESRPNYGKVINTTYWYGGAYYFHAKGGTTISLTNRVVISWSPGDFSGTNYLNATLATVRTNTLLSQ